MKAVSRRQQQVVGEQEALAGEQLEAAPAGDGGCTPGVEGQGTADDEEQEDQDKGAARRVGGEGVDRGQDAGADQEGAEQAQSEKAVMASSTVQLLKAPRFSVTARE